MSRSVRPRRARLLLMVVAAQVFLGGGRPAFATPSFSPSAEVITDSEVTDRISGVGIRGAQPECTIDTAPSAEPPPRPTSVVDTGPREGKCDHLRPREVPIRRYSMRIPKGWRFAVTGLRESTFQSCADPVSSPPGTDPSVDPMPQWLRNMEAIGYALLRVSTNETRDPDTWYHSEGTGTFESRTAPAVLTGYTTGGSARPGASLWFLRWSEVERTAILCGTLRVSTSLAIATSPTTPPESGRRIPIRQREVIFQATLQLLPDDSWEFAFDLDAVPGLPGGFRSLTDNPYFIDSDLSIIDFQFSLSGQSAGNFNLDPEGKSCLRPNNDPPLPQNRCALAFSRTPVVGASYEFGTELWPCPSSSSCLSIAKRFTIPISPLPSTFVHRPAKLTGPTTVGVPTGYAVLTNTSELTVSWEQPPQNPVEAVRAYVLTLAKPLDENSRHSEYLVVDRGDPAFDTRLPCAPDGKGTTCTFTFSFPLGALRGDGKYDASLITVYQDGHRTDGRCDDGTGEGALCDPTEPAFKVVPPGISYWQFWITSRPWPNVYVEEQVFRPTGSAVLFNAPAYMLLVDFSLKQAEFVAWNLQGPAKRYFASSNGIVGADTAGAVSFDGGNIGGSADSWRFDGFAGPNVSTGLGTNPGTCRPPTGSPLLVQACGVFTVYNLRSAPAFNGVPTAFVEPFEGRRI